MGAAGTRRLLILSLALRFALLGLAALPIDVAPAAAAEPEPPGTIAEAACRIVEKAAQSFDVPVDLLTRLVWVESRFQAGVTSPAGAQGIAQFMPMTAAERGLANPFDPEQAIPKAAQLLADLARQFGNIGLAAAAYNAGPNRVANWLAGSGMLPAETLAYVVALTGRTAEDWASDRRGGGHSGATADGRSCIEVTAALRTEEGADRVPLAPWGVQLSGNFSKPIALASFARAQRRYHGIIGDLQPMIIGGVLRSRGTRPFYRVMVPASSRAQADQFCRAIMARGGACVALRS